MDSRISIRMAYMPGFTETAVGWFRFDTKRFSTGFVLATGFEPQSFSTDYIFTGVFF